MEDYEHCVCGVSCHLRNHKFRQSLRYPLRYIGGSKIQDFINLTRKEKKELMEVRDINVTRKGITINRSKIWDVNVTRKEKKIEISQEEDK